MKSLSTLIVLLGLCFTVSFSQNQALDLVTKGATLFQAKKYEDALDCFIKAQQYNPSDTIAPLYGSYSAMQLQKNTVAAQMMENYIDKGGRDASNFNLLAQLYRVGKQNEKALQVLDKGIKNIPESRVSLKAERVNVLLDMQRVEDAKIELKELVRLDPKNAQYALNLGILYDNEASQYTEAIRQLREVSKKTRMLERKIKDAEEMEKVFADEVKRLAGLIAKQPQNADLKRQKAEAEAKQNENRVALGKAKEEWMSSGKETAAMDGLFAKVADLTAKQSTARQAAKEAYNKALTAEPNNYDALFNMGVFYFNEAVEMKVVVEAMDMKEYNSKGKQLEAKVYGKFKQSQPYFTKARTIKEESQLVETLKSLDTILKQFEAKGIKPDFSAEPPAYTYTFPSTTPVSTESTNSNTGTVIEKKPVYTSTTRYALIIGNSAYLGGKSLEGRPLNDATDITARLESVGFTVLKYTDLTKQQDFLEAFRSFGRQAKGAEVALFFYAGHGVEVNGENYVIPTQAQLTTREDVDYEAFPVKRVIDEFSKLQAKNSIILLDACRENPFRSWVRGDSRGFKMLDITQLGMDNLFVGYATAPGSVAQNGTGRNGVFTAALLKFLRGGQRFDDIFQDTVNEVLIQTNNAQRPFQTSSLRTRLVF